jgi:ABC-type multidrug transport system fused ATPase/permease subunit
MLKAVKASLAFMTPKEKSKWISLTGFRGFLSILDLAGILAIGFVVTSTAVFLTSGSSPDRILEFAGLRIPAVTAQTLTPVLAIILATFLLKAFLSIIVTKKTALFVATIEARAAREITESVFGGDLSGARLRSREEMSFAIQFGSPAAFNSLLNLTSTVVAEGTLFVLICLGFLVVNPIATVAAISYFGVVGLVMQYFIGTLMARAGKEATEGTMAANGAVNDLISVFRELLVLGLRYKYFDKIYQSRIVAANSAATQTYLSAMPRYIVEAALLIGVAGFILAQALSGDLVSSAATVGVFLSGGFRLTAAMLPFQAAMLAIKGTIPVARTAQVILEDKNPKRDRPLIPSPERNLNSRIEPIGVEFHEVSFNYTESEAFALADFSLTIYPGQQVAFIGSSGAGKSTLADLMCGVLTPTQGQVRRFTSANSNISINECAISYVPQKPGLVTGSLADNIALGADRNEVDEARVNEALTNAHLYDVVAELEHGIHTQLGNYQDSLSGGQIQRLGLARALYNKPGLLVMDEATSALDADSENEIAKALEHMRGQVTVVLIAHRLNTVQNADKVFLIEAGKVVDSGTFQELVSRNPSVDRLVQLMKVNRN